MFEHGLYSVVSLSRESMSSLQALMLRSGAVDDYESRTSCLLTRLAHGALLRRLGEHSWRVEVVDSRLEETRSQGQAQHLLRLQLQLVLGLTHPGERAVDLQRLRAKKKRESLGNVFTVTKLLNTSPAINSILLLLWRNIVKVCVCVY